SCLPRCARSKAISTWIQSALTGESLPVDATEGQTGYAGTLVQHGEATADVIAAGLKTRFGRLARLVQDAKHPNQREPVIFGIVCAMILLDGEAGNWGAALRAVFFHHLPALETLSFVLILLVASVPIALPATSTLATAPGARGLAHQGVWVTPISVIEEAAGMDVSCSDKTGTITQNRSTLVGVHPYAPLMRQRYSPWRPWSATRPSRTRRIQPSWQRRNSEI
ncbi:MAG: hypothetical protein N3A60_10535, partial [Thermanaerothrix sp.]|nr:hypothetical protein [Thermanaerothrix sp.]